MRYWFTRIAKLKLVRVVRQHRLAIASVALGMISGFFMWTLFGAQNIAYNYGSSRTCITSPRLAPSLAKTQSHDAFQVTRPASLSIGRFALYAHSICATTQAPPREQTTYTYQERLFNSPWLARHIIVAAPKYPVLTSRGVDAKMLPPDVPLSLKLSAADKTFSYALRLDQAMSPCKTTDAVLSCDLTPLGLGYATKYTLTLERQYDGRTTSTLATVPLQTITPTTVVSTSIPPGSNIQDKPTNLTLTTDKQITTLGTVTLVAKQSDGSEVPMPITSSFKDKTITISLGQELPRKTTFELRVAALRASDGSSFVGKLYTLPFSTSGGPKVQGANIGTRSVSLNQTIVLTFDQTLLATQPIAPNITFSVNGAPQTAAFSINSNKLTIKPAAAFPLCATFTIKLGNNLQNQYGVAGDSAWSINSRAICYTAFSIGTSVRGRPLTAYKFGSGPDLILYLGAMHGSEANSKKIMDEWFNELNTYPERIPAHRSIVVVPAVNPDGVALGSRFNANGVDLNRNFPANDWKSVVTTPGSAQPSAAGGPSPLSEPESQAVANYIRQTHPRLVMSYHSKAAVVEANEAGDSVAIALAYAAKARYRAVPKSQSAPIFQYDTTGAMEDWLRDKYGWPAIVVELASSTSSEFVRNRDALWYTAKL